MSFDKFPIVDDNSKNSEESVLIVKSFFSQRNGFISRTETPDFGCDIDVELIINSTEASSKKFPIQIKSEENVSFIQKDEVYYVSKPFKTSRLNYLCNRPPSYGLIIIYDGLNKVCYYDYVEEIVGRLTLERNDEKWKEKESVNIHIPQSNILNQESIKNIYTTFFKRFQAHDLLINKHGNEFAIPNFSFTEDKEGESSISKLSTVELIKKYGLFFINSYDIILVHNMLVQVSFQEISTSKELILIASIVYAEMGKCIEAEFYLSKANQILEQYDESEKEIIKFSQIKVDFLLGRRSSNDFFEDLKSLKEVTKNKYNEIQLKINLLYYSILEQVAKNKFDESIEKAIMETFQAINALDLEEAKKHLFNVYHAENLHMYISSWMLKKISNIRIKDALRANVNIQERVSSFQKANSYITYATTIVLKAWQFGKDNSNKLVEAHALYALGYFFFTKEYDFLILAFKDPSPDFEKNFKRAFQQSIQSHNLFFELGLFKEARLSLINAYELNRLAKLFYQIDITTDSTNEDILVGNLRASHHTMGIKDEYRSIVDSAFQNLLKINNQDTNDGFQNMSDEQIAHYAEVVHAAYGLPPERLINITNEIKALKYFYSHCDTGNFQILCDLRHMQSPQTQYAEPTKFIIVSKITGIESLPNEDIERLATDFGALKKK
jgi:hypothetical protein